MILINSWLEGVRGTNSTIPFFYISFLTQRFVSPSFYISSHYVRVVYTSVVLLQLSINILSKPCQIKLM